jgi:hypothetical protein
MEASLLVGVGIDFLGAFRVSRSDASLAGRGTLVLRLPYLGGDSSFILLVLPRSPPRAPSFQVDDRDEDKENGDDNDEGNDHCRPLPSFEGKRIPNIAESRPP